MKKIRILGIDPGSINCGYGVIDMTGNKLELVELGTIKAKKKYENLNDRLKEIHIRLLELIKRTDPDETAFETMFYSKNAQSLIKLSHARAAAILSAAINDLPIFEYSPKEVKKAVTGRGAGSKEQVQFMVQKILDIKEAPELFDVTDALAVAICHSQKRELQNKQSNSWAEYIKNHPDKVIKQ